MTNHPRIKHLCARTFRHVPRTLVQSRPEPLPSPFDGLPCSGQAHPRAVVQTIELDRLTVAPAGRRKSASIRWASRRADPCRRKLQSLIVVPAEDFEYHVVAGERRLAALQLLAKKGRIPPISGAVPGD